MSTTVRIQIRKFDHKADVCIADDVRTVERERKGERETERQVDNRHIDREREREREREGEGGRREG